jgi:hypothetical protein
MDASQVLDQSHTLVTQAVDDLPEAEWDVPGVCGSWSTKDIIAHLGSYERLLIDILQTFQGKEVTPYIRTYLQDFEAFNTQVVESRKYQTAQQVLNEYQEGQVQTTSLLAQIPADKVNQSGTMPWWSADYCLTDIVDMLCAHSKEHCDQIVAFRERSRQPSS